MAVTVNTGLIRKCDISGCWWLTPVIPAPQEAEIRSITVPSHPMQIVHETLSKKPITKYWSGGVAQCQGPEFRPQYHKKTQKCDISVPWYFIQHQNGLFVICQ
jgi:hypothetical protein